jgi:hypothetical protein
MAEDWARPVVFWEITATDSAKMAAFYKEMFNWQMTDGPAPRIAAGIGGPLPGPGGSIRPGAHPGVSLYVQVLDLRESLAKGERLGGKTIIQPTDTPGGPTVAGLLDPEGNRLMLVQQ